MEEKTSLVCYKLGHCIAYVKSSGYVASLNIGKTSYLGGMVFNTKAHTGVDALAYPYTATQHWSRSPRYICSCYFTHPLQ
jgi:hypothetical protein